MFCTVAYFLRCNNYHAGSYCSHCNTIMGCMGIKVMVGVYIILIVPSVVATLRQSIAIVVTVSMVI